MSGGDDEKPAVKLELLRLSQVEVTGLSRRATRRLVLRADAARRSRGEAGLVRRQGVRDWWLVDIVLLRTEFPTLDMTQFALRTELDDVKDKVAELEDVVFYERRRSRALGARLNQLELQFMKDGSYGGKS